MLERAGVSGGEPSSAVADVREALSGLGYGTDEIRDVLRDLPATPTPRRCCATH